mmetsp:Transcript_9472/g.22332  ORF Transcript_9472/g.22332 Transcript_9472/m.22332 type:complete len:201 (+) Transcript_9472:301-903(+)
MLVCCYGTTLEVPLQITDSLIDKKLEIVDDSHLRYNRCRSAVSRLRKEIRVKALGRLHVSKESKFGTHVILQIHFQGRQQETSPPGIFPHATAPTRRPTDIAFAVVEERDDVWIALSSDEEVTIEHFRQSSRGNVLFNRAIPPCLVALDADCSVLILDSKLDRMNESGDSRTCYDCRCNQNVWGGYVIDEYRRRAFRSCR